MSKQNRHRVFGRHALAIAVSACTTAFIWITHKIPAYSVSEQNVATVRSIAAQIKVGNFTGTKTKDYCTERWLIGPGNGQTFSSYIAEAFSETVQIAGTKSQVLIELSGTLKHIDVNCGFSLTKTWTIEMELSINDQSPFTVKTVHKFRWYPFRSRPILFAQSFIPSVQQFVSDVLYSPEVQAAALRQFQYTYTEQQGGS